MRRLPDLWLTGAKVLRDGALEPAEQGIATGRLGQPQPGAAEVDLAGCLILPGIVDLHGPTPFPLRAARDLDSVLAALDRRAARGGVTTGHLVQHWGWTTGWNGHDGACNLMQAVARRRAGALTDLRVKPCVEIRLAAMAAPLLSAMDLFNLRYAVLTDSLEPLMALHRRQPQEFEQRAKGLGLTAAELLARMAAAFAGAGAVPASLRALAGGFDMAGVRFGSSGDPDAETRELHAMMGARIAEFPGSRRAAMAAPPVGDGVVLSARRIAAGDPEEARLMQDLLRAGGRVALASQGDPAALVAAAFRLADQGLCSLATGWGALSTIPAALLGLHDRGRIASGLRADLVIVDAATRRIAAVICDGRLVHARPEWRSRFRPRPATRFAAQ
ncbi:alkylphosphonate utilization protein [Szabonella alba]|uniref:Alkylphosphonate utilization protein n=1 Tax=Szabonella alba TaxID=2804194 RepID=A0A8K0V4R0_9RHOB|nr:alkylphosphonate utilization protein [Szabonella alba]MBL4915789.1 alkylphosphonate utilization protein [Szabonella alba]